MKVKKSKTRYEGFRTHWNARGWTELGAVLTDEEICYAVRSHIKELEGEIGKYEDRIKRLVDKGRDLMSQSDIARTIGVSREAARFRANTSGASVRREGQRTMVSIKKFIKSLRKSQDILRVRIGRLEKITEKHCKLF